MSAPEPVAADEVTLYFYVCDDIRRAPPRGHGWAHRCRTLAARRQQATRRRH